mmetsp:Transcript_33988/g.85322  ORF Transcript_33988/g.85322 Transcript_33988/m.85322 type:complete len:235 (+) Transcript_33988:163-867(+)
MPALPPTPPPDLPPLGAGVFSTSAHDLGLRELDAPPPMPCCGPPAPPPAPPPIMGGMPPASRLGMPGMPTPGIMGSTRGSMFWSRPTPPPYPISIWRVSIMVSSGVMPPIMPARPSMPGKGMLGGCCDSWGADASPEAFGEVELVGEEGVGVADDAGAPGMGTPPRTCEEAGMAEDAPAVCEPPWPWEASCRAWRSASPWYVPSGRPNIMRCCCESERPPCWNAWESKGVFMIG